MLGGTITDIVVVFFNLPLIGVLVGGKIIRNGDK